VSPALVRLHIVRVRRTYDLLITKHVLATVEGAKRPTLRFHGVHGRRGTLEMDLHGKDSGLCGAVRPLFLSRSGEPASLPAVFEMPWCASRRRSIVLDADIPFASAGRG